MSSIASTVTPPPGPTRKHTSNLPIRVLVFDTKTDKRTQRFTYNFLEPETQDKIKRLIIWAANNHHSVEICHVVDDDTT